MTAHSATVETLTAEVRVLMMGNRQITLSVVKQLDWVISTGLQPFGRVRPSGGYNDRPGIPGVCLFGTCGFIQVVGRVPDGEPDAGSLVRSAACKCGDRRTNAYDMWIDLPLIVLAGLR